MLINVSEALCSETAVKVYVRRTSGEYVNGDWVQNSNVERFKTLASPQPTSFQELQTLSEGDRDRQIFTFITKKRLRTVEDDELENPDVVEWDGSDYKLIKRKPWGHFGYYRTIGVKLRKS